MIKKRDFTFTLDEDLNPVYDNAHGDPFDFLKAYGTPGSLFKITVQEDYPVLGIRRFYRKCILPVAAQGLSECYGDLVSDREAHRVVCNEIGIKTTTGMTGPQHWQFNRDFMAWCASWLGVSFPVDNEPIERVLNSNDALIRGLRWKDV